jgi:cardiolipin synthase
LNGAIDKASGRNRSGALAAAILATSALLSGCASIAERSLAGHQGAGIRWAGARGPLTRAQVEAVNRRLAIEAPDADALQRHLAIEQAVSSGPLYTGNEVRVLRDGAETFPAMFAAIRSARQSVLLEYYIFDNVSSEGQSLLDVLEAKRAEGVQVTVLYDAVGSSGTDEAFLAALRDAGVQLLAFNPINPLHAHRRWSINDRDHRKLLVADHRVAIVGGINLSRDYERSAGSSSPGSAPGPAPGPAPGAAAGETVAAPVWRDTDIEITGPSVPALEQLFYAHWHSQGGPRLASEGDPGGTAAAGDQVVHIIGSTPEAPAPAYYATVLSAIRSAERSIWITAAYFVPTHQERRELRAAARRGVDVRLLVPAKSDSGPALALQHAAYGDLLERGVKIYERDSVILHSKSMVVDDVWAIVGSSNFDHRSVLFNDEVDAAVIGRQTAAALEDLFQADLADAHAVDLRAWRHRSLRERCREAFWRLWINLM